MRIHQPRVAMVVSWKTEPVGKLASQAEISVWLQATGELAEVREYSL